MTVLVSFLNRFPSSCRRYEQSSERTKFDRHSPTGAGQVTLPSRNVCVIFLAFHLGTISSSPNLSVSLTPLLLVFCYSDLTRNYLNGTIPKEWGSLNLVNMYITVSLLFLHFSADFSSSYIQEVKYVLITFI